MGIIYKDLTENGPIEECRSLCNKLMDYQAEKANQYKEILRAMNFETRLKPAFEEAKERCLYVAYDDISPVGYVFCDAFVVTDAMKKTRPDWARDIPKDTEGLYPVNLPTPCKVAHLNNLYILPEYRGAHIGKELMGRGMAWMRNVPNVRYLFVHVSNGNNAGSLYERYGFHFSHSVWDGFIEAYVQDIPFQKVAQHE